MIIILPRKMCLKNDFAIDLCNTAGSPCKPWNGGGGGIGMLHCTAACVVGVAEGKDKLE